MKSKRLKDLTHTGPVTSLHFAKKNVLLAGQGPYLSVYGLSNGAKIRLAKLRIFARERVHGIITHQNSENHAGDINEDHSILLCVWGGQSLCLTRLEDLLAPVWSNRQYAQISDWILHATFVSSSADPKYSSTTDPVQLALITAYNALILYSLGDSGRSFELCENHGSTERCILYSACITVLNPTTPTQSSRLIIAAGTVFGSILLWSHVLQGKSSGLKKLHARLVSHEGSIFGLALSDGLDYLVSSSDDRSVRLWNIVTYREALRNDLDQEPKPPKDLTLSGFSTEENQCLTDEKPVAIGWGHHARIWGVKFLTKEYEIENSDQLGLQNSTYLPFISWSEDLTAKIWKLEDNGNLIASHTYQNAHSGKHIWSLALFDDQLATGGSDGAVALREMPLASSAPSSAQKPKGTDEAKASRSEAIYSLNAKDNACSALLEIVAGGDQFKNYVVLSNRAVLVSLVSGKVLYGWCVYDHEIEFAWILLGDWPNCRNASIMGTWAGEGIVALGDGNGQAAMLDFRDSYDELISRCENLTWQRISNGRIANILTSSADNSTLFMIPNTFNEKDKILLQKLSSLDSKNPIMIEKGWSLDRPENFVVTAFGIIQLNKDMFVSILGSRHGALAVYILQNNDNIETVHQASKILRRVHDQDAATAIACAPTTAKQASDTMWQITSTGRIGSIMVHELDLSNLEDLRMTLIHSGKPSLLPDIEGVKVLHRTGSQGSQTLLYGFRSKNFIIWNDTTKTEVGAGKFDCGGGNRSWSFDCEVEDDGTVNGLFIFTKAGRCHIVRYWNILHNSLIQLPFHGREIKALAISPKVENARGERKLLSIIATGAEDTVVRLSYLHPITSEIVSLSIEKSHTTGLQDLLWSPCGGWLFSSGGVEEVFCWRIRVLGDNDDIRLGVVQEATLDIDGQLDRLPDLRVTGMSILSVCSDDGTTIGFMLAMVRSNSSIKITYYDTVQMKFYTIFDGMYKKSCLLQAKLHVALGKKCLLFTAGTDGFVSAWDFTEQLSAHHINVRKDKLIATNHEQLLESSPTATTDPFITSFALHQSSIKSLDLVGTTSDVAFLVTGGDDTAVVLTKLYFLQSGATGDSFSLQHSMVKLECAHASAVTAAIFISPYKSTLKGLSFATGAVDQRVKLWHVDNLSSDSPEFSLIDEKFASTPDLAAIGFVHNGDVEEEGIEEEVSGALVVAGVGVEVFGVS